MGFLDKAKNKAQELSGKGKQHSSDPDVAAEGHKDEAAGDLKQAGEKVKDAFKH